MSKERAFKICQEMLTQREYNIIDIDKENYVITAIKPDGKEMTVFFNSTPKFDTKSMKEIIQIMYTNNLDHSLIIYKDNITAATKSALNQTFDMELELFSLEDLQYNITKHRLQPKFEKLPDNEAEEFKKKYGIKHGILRHDKPISRFYNYSKGDVIRIHRKENNSDYITYRIVR